MENTNHSVESSAVQPEDSKTISSAEVRVEPTSPPEYAQSDPANQTSIPDELLALIRLEIDKRFQSAKDKRWAQLERQYGDLHELSQQAGQPLLDPPASEDNPALAEKLIERAEALLSRFGLGNTPEAAALLRQPDNLEGPGGYLELIDKVIDLAVREAVPAEVQTPSPAGVISPGGGSSANPDLAEIYQQRRKHIRPGDVNALTALKREFREKGLNIF